MYFCLPVLSSASSTFVVISFVYPSFPLNPPDVLKTSQVLVMVGIYGVVCVKAHTRCSFAMVAPLSFLVVCGLASFIP
jgi:hypothetical protein